jgi:SAM-dependent methyltransferase/uncharacterized protein YbaR (Trm112 family)
MYSGFPKTLLDVVACTRDAKPLATKAESDADARFIRSGSVACTACGAEYQITDGILDMVGDGGPADNTSAREMALRDQSARSAYSYDIDPDDGRDAIEIPRTLARLGDVRTKFVLELGCGTGRFTRRLVAGGAGVLAVDFSRDSLLVNARRMPDGDRDVGLARGDVGTFKVAHRAFDLALSTLYSNLPNRELRLASSRIVSEGLSRDGKYVVSAHHYHLRDSLKKAPRTGMYAGGVFYQTFERAEFERELREVFGDVHQVPIDIWIPYISRSRALRPSVSRLAESVPAVNLLGQLLVATARPAR